MDLAYKVIVDGCWKFQKFQIADLEGVTFSEPILLDVKM
jgi:hypothetical protein